MGFPVNCRCSGCSRRSLLRLADSFSSRFRRLTWVDTQSLKKRTPLESILNKHHWIDVKCQYYKVNGFYILNIKELEEQFISSVELSSADGT